MNISRSCSPESHVLRAVEPTSIAVISSPSALPMALILLIRLSARAESFYFSGSFGLMRERIEARMVSISFILFLFSDHYWYVIIISHQDY